MEIVNAKELQNIRMAGHNEKKYPVVIDEGIVKEWVAIGWVDLRPAAKDDYKKYPTVVRDPQ